MKLRNTGIYDTPIPEDELELSRLYDFGGPGFAVLLVRLEARALEVLARHGVVSDGINLRPGSAIWRKDGSSSLVGVTLKSPPAVFDTRSLVFQIEIWRCQNTHVKTLHARLIELGDSPDAIVVADLLAETDHSIEILCGYAFKIGEVADRLFKGRPSEHFVDSAKKRKAKAKQGGKVAKAGNDAHWSELREATMKRLVSELELEANRTSKRPDTRIVANVRFRMEQDPEITAILARMNERKKSDLYSLRRMRWFLNELRLQKAGLPDGQANL